MADWINGHKASCKKFKAECEAQAVAVLAQMRDSGLPGGKRVQDLDRLDREGPYKIAVQEGLYETIIGMLREEVESAGADGAGGWRRDGPSGASYLCFISNTLFRGQRSPRADGMARADIGRADGSRVAEFVRSDPDAWPLWLAAADKAARAPFSKDLGARSYSHVVHAGAHSTARNIWACLTQVSSPPCPRPKSYMFVVHVFSLSSVCERVRRSFEF